MSATAERPPEYIECCECCGAEIPLGDAEHDADGVAFCGPCWETIDWTEE